MEFSGEHYRRIGSTKRLSFYASGLYIDNITGSGVLGFSGAWQGTGRHLEFTFNKGKIIDPENRYVYSYLPNEEFPLSGNISDNNYQYFLNSIPICYVGEKEKNIIDRFYVHSTGCTINTDVYIAIDKPSNILTMGNSFSTTGTLNVNVQNGNPNLPFIIFSGAFSGGDFLLTNLPIEVENNANIIVSGIETIETGYYTDHLTLETSIGDITTNFTVDITE